jgi:hypothetical protein
VLRVCGEENVGTGIGHLAEGRHHGRFVSVADVVLAAGCAVGAVRELGDDHVRRVDVCAVLFFGQAEGEDVALVEQALGFALAFSLPLIQIGPMPSTETW